ncbi:LysR family transcriptional regulator [Mycobacterium sp.]|jgi:hypothetical protein|uniref:LysR family transcriptional regulator n=1 Tax=Mycobacterium sp. TaxID=1785 RepID=UPI003F9D64E3
MEMLHLRYFVAVAEELNHSAAARPLRMAASPLSQRGATREWGQNHDDRRGQAMTKRLGLLRGWCDIGAVGPAAAGVYCARAFAS